MGITDENVVNIPVSEVCLCKMEPNVAGRSDKFAPQHMGTSHKNIGIIYSNAQNPLHFQVNQHYEGHI